MIYFIQETSTYHVKIGVSSNPAERMRQLQTAQPSKLRLVAVMDGSQQEEKELHRKFNNVGGEWFEPTDDLWDFIKSNTMNAASLSIPAAPAPQPQTRKAWGLRWNNIRHDFYYLIWLQCVCLAVISITFWIAPYINPNIGPLSTIVVGVTSFSLLFMGSLQVMARCRMSKTTTR